MLKDIAYRYKPEYLIIEDFNNGHSISPWDRRSIIRRAQKNDEGLTSLDTEFEVMCKEAAFLASLPFDQIVFCRDNHSLFLERYLEFCEFKDDPENLELALKLALSHFYEKNITESGLKIKGFSSAKFKFLKRDESFAPNGIENSIHGFTLRGRRTSSLAAFDRAYGAISVGHTHTAAIYRNARSCGTMTYKTSDKIKYIEGANDWTYTMIFEHENGSRQSVNIINGKHRL